jgi:putative oxidoreductase
MAFALLVLRAVIGAVFGGHGAQKVLGRFGGHGPEGTGQFFHSIGLRPGRPMALAAGTTEMTCGTLVALGLATPGAAAGLESVLATATWTVHRPHGFWADKGGFEYPLVMTAALFTVVAAGPEAISLDALAFERPRWGLGWALASAAAATCGAAAVIKAGQRRAAAEPAPAEAQQAPAGAATP